MQNTLRLELGEYAEVKVVRPVLLASSNWNNSAKAGVAYLNSNNDATNSNTNIGRQLELRDKPLNRHFNLYREVKYTTMEGGC